MHDTHLVFESLVERKSTSSFISSFLGKIPVKIFKENARVFSNTNIVYFLCIIVNVVFGSSDHETWQGKRIHFAYYNSVSLFI